MLYAMHVVPCSTFLKWGADDISEHQTLLARGDLVEYNHSVKGPVCFVSHQWVSYDHPDPSFEQLRTLQRFMGKIKNGKIAELEYEWTSKVVFNSERVSLRGLTDWVNVSIRTPRVQRFV